MNKTGWRVLLGLLGCSAFFTGLAGGVHLGLVRVHRGYSLPDGGEAFGIAALAGLVVGHLAVASLTDLLPPSRMALIPTAGAVVGAAVCLTLGQEPRYWVGASALLLIGALPPVVVHLRSRRAAARRSPAPSR
ncbi:hypothetical protein [Streptomyces sp. NPDC048659]|uniref:hypothetical protein n=1 Tax=Streptomyces sp. NPDC048659 TaxID=3155489 RepID=UPI003447944C